MAIKVVVLLFVCLAVAEIVEARGKYKGGCICTRLYKPVCSKGGKSYLNLCFLKCARRRLACEGKCPCKPK
ncbi:leech-derived tryptase inhibitor C-like isoform X1 [Crassostrea virginica]